MPPFAAIFGDNPQNVRPAEGGLGLVIRCVGRGHGNEKHETVATTKAGEQVTGFPIAGIAVSFSRLCVTGDICDCLFECRLELMGIVPTFDKSADIECNS